MPAMAGEGYRLFSLTCMHTNKTKIITYFFFKIKKDTASSACPLCLKLKHFNLNYHRLFPSLRLFPICPQQSTPPLCFLLSYFSSAPPPSGNFIHYIMITLIAQAKFPMLSQNYVPLLLECGKDVQG